METLCGQMTTLMEYLILEEKQKKNEYEKKNKKMKYIKTKKMNI
jgi:hypothetical protein